MAFYRAFGLADMAAVRSFIDTNMLSEGFENRFSDTDFVAYRRKNDINETTGTEAYFVPVFILHSTTFGITLAKSASGGGLVGEIPETDAPKRTLTAPYDVFLVSTPYIVAFAVKGASGTAAFVASSLDYRELDTTGVDDDATHYSNMKNNNQCVFEVGLESAGRVLYAGNIASNSVFNQVLVTNAMSRDDSVRKTPQGPMPVSTVLGGTTNNFQGLLRGVFFTQSTVFHLYDRGVTAALEPYRFLRNSFTNSGVLVRED